MKNNYRQDRVSFQRVRGVIIGLILANVVVWLTLVHIVNQGGQ